MKENNLLILALTLWQRLTNQGRMEEAAWVLALINRRNWQHTWPNMSTREANVVIK